MNSKSFFFIGNLKTIEMPNVRILQLQEFYSYKWYSTKHRIIIILIRYEVIFQKLFLHDWTI